MQVTLTVNAETGALELLVEDGPRSDADRETLKLLQEACDHVNSGGDEWDAVSRALASLNRDD